MDTRVLQCQQRSISPCNLLKIKKLHIYQNTFNK